MPSFSHINSVHIFYPQGDIVLVADEFDDGWMRGLRLDDLEVNVKSSPICVMSLF